MDYEEWIQNIKSASQHAFTSRSEATNSKTLSYIAEMATTHSRDHVITGTMTVFLRILQLLIALTVVGLAAYGLTFLVFSGVELNMFTVR